MQSTFFKSEVKLLLTRLASVKIGDNSVEFFQNELGKAQELSADVRTNPDIQESHRERIEAAPKIPLTDANSQMLKHDLRPSPSGLELSYYRELANQDPALALTGLRIELEIIGQNLAKGFNIEVPKNASVARVFHALANGYAITNKQYNLVQSITRLANSAVHGAPISRDDANAVIDTADVLRDSYLSWLSWGFNENEPL
ncbi:hypothetical protein [Acaryochloris sp. IP29b_bin.137]|uniref:hypothetical protein n=1 Tax=Acaryochloris sp. IP29b_bin.137 TaxID=2969217 RepID=UPI002636EB87|nr:hypothetical protein [Acaryochloris sp. IP29b_bin.137]